MAWGATSILEVTVGYVANLQECRAVTHWMATDAGSGKTELEIAQDVLDTQKTGGNGTLPGELAKIMASSVNLNRIEVQVVYPVRRVRKKASMTIQGLVTAVCTAQNLQCTMTKNTDFAGRSQVGAIHIGGLPTNAYSDGLLTTNGFTRLNDFADWYLNFSNQLAPEPLINWFPVILNKEPIPLSNPVRYRIKGASRVASTIQQGTIRVMRRRTVGVGI